uniref:ATAQ protein n=1 Tax=Hyalomma marginatum marginatum TaxID=127000 RepID=E5D580_9ACAR|nr:ATAQ protein [Hyalomma marginatum marginatum]
MGKMNNERPLLLLALVARLASVASAEEAADPNICASVGKLCGDVPCAPLNGGKYFTCSCEQERYFNATAQRCYHLDTCSATMCHPGKCLDNDGNDMARCDCSGIHGMTKECEVDPAFKDECVKSGGQQSFDKNGLPRCVCPHGTKPENDRCVSIACLIPNFTCKDICNNTKLREDDRCCQNWEAGSCDGHYEEGTFCLPGTVGNGSICTNVCAEDLLGSICEHGCTYENSSVPDYKCNCDDDEELSANGRTCRARVLCNEEEERSCQENDQKCVYKDGKASCECPPGSALINGVCSDECSFKCQPLLSKCVIDSNLETCVCEYPLKWDSTKRQCILDKQFVYITTFEQYQSPVTNNTASRCATTERLVESAMKNLYGKSLISTRLLKCGEEHEVELSFSEEPAPALLNRMHLCENEDSIRGCFFPPALYIVNGTSSDPRAVDLCDAYLNNTDAVSSGSHKCVSEGAGRYTLLCALRSSGAGIVEQGFLKVQQCHEGCHPNPCPEDCICEPSPVTSYKCNCREDVPTSSVKPHHEKSSFAAPPAGGRKSTNRVWASVAIIIGILIPAVIVVILLMKRKTSYIVTPVKKASSKDFQPLATEEC